MIKQVKLENYIKILSGFAFKSNLFSDDSSLTPLIRIRDIKRGFSETFYSGEFNKNYLIYKGDMLIGMDGEFNVENWKGIPSLLNQRVCKLEISDDKLLDKQYLFYIINGKLKQIEDKTSFVTVKHLSIKDINNIEIPLPPLSIQKAIAEKLDKADALRKKDKELLAQYDELAQAIFIDMFGDPVKNEKSWEIKSLDEVCNKITDGEHGTVKRLNSGYLYLMARNIRNNEIDFSEVSYISEVDHNKIYRRCNAQEGDILLICVGATIGRTCIVPKMQEFSLARSVALLKPNKNKLNSQYLNTYLSLDSIQLRIKSSSNTSAQAGLYTGAIKEFKITIPPIKLQTQFAEKIQNIEAQKAIVKQQAQQSEDLFQALLQESFNFNQTHHEKPQTALSGA